MFISIKKNNILRKRVFSDFILFIISIIWGTAFVFQKAASTKIDGIHFNILRFLISAIAMFIIHIFFFPLKKKKKLLPSTALQYHLLYLAGGALLAIGINLQQIALLYSSAGKAGVITGLYVVLVPIIGVCMGYRNTLIQWISAFLAIVGLYFMSIHGTFYLKKEDTLLIFNAVTWALYILYVGHVSHKLHTISFAMWQYLYCSILSIIISIIVSSFSIKTSFLHSLFLLPSLLIEGFLSAWESILYTSIIATCIGFSLQIYAQKNTPASHTALIISLEAVFAMVFGVLILNEYPSPREIIGATIIFTAIILSQVYGQKNNHIKKLVKTKRLIFL